MRSEATMIRIPKQFLFGLLLLAQAGCHSIGPGTVPRDRSDYSAALSDSWKRQTLLNVVKLRYLDPPMFIDVANIVSGYTLQFAASTIGQISSAEAIQRNSITAGGNATYIDRPTITYTPLTGNRYIRGLMNPLPPESVFFTIQSGWPADAVMFATVAEINGLKNQQTSIDGVTAPDPKFMRVLALLRKIQLSGGVGMRIMMDSQKQQTTLLTFRTKDISPESLNDVHELRSLLKLDLDASEIRLVYGGTSSSDKEVAVRTYSIIQQLATMASQVDVPEQDVKEGRTSPGWETIQHEPTAVRIVRIRCSKMKPSDAFVAIEYRGHWFWIDDRDIKSKRAFSFMSMLFTLADTGERENLPLITIPAQ